MKVKVLFFGATADAAGTRTEEIDLPSGVKSSDAFARIVEIKPALAKHKLLYAINQEYVGGDEVIEEDDELAVFTAVSGG